MAGSDDDDASASAKFLASEGELCRVCNIPTLKAYGIDEGAFFAAVPKRATDAIASGSPLNGPKGYCEEDCRRL